MSRKKRIHVSLPGPISDALEALAALEGRAVSDVLEELSRKRLTDLGALPAVSAEAIAAEVKKKTKRNK